MLLPQIDFHLFSLWMPLVKQCDRGESADRSVQLRGDARAAQENTPRLPQVIILIQGRGAEHLHHGSLLSPVAALAPTSMLTDGVAVFDRTGGAP